MENTNLLNQIIKEIDKLEIDLADTKYAKFVKDKKVIIVGPDPRILGTKLGKQIDNYDVVIRLNTTINYIPFPPNLIEDIGNKTDCIYLCPSSMRELTESGSCIKTTIKVNNIIKKFKKTKLKFINYQNGNKNGKYIIDDYIYPNELNAIKKIIDINNKNNQTKINIHNSSNICHSLERILGLIGNTNINTVPRTGCLAIFEALCAGAKSITIEGMSFYNGGKHIFRKEVIADLDPLKNHLNANSPHNSLIELEFIKILLKLYPNKIIVNNDYLGDMLSN
jgi:hypothetical protein